jgi:tetratricopeptide (TPR) repeat protein
VNNKFKIIISIGLLLLTLQVNSQNQHIADSLEIVLSIEQNDNKKLEILLELAEVLHISDPERGCEFTKEALNLSKENNSPKFTVRSYLFLTKYYWEKSEINLALEHADKAIKLSKREDLTKENADAQLLIGNIYTDIGDFSKNYELLYNALEVY